MPFLKCENHDDCIVFYVDRLDNCPLCDIKRSKDYIKEFLMKMREQLDEFEEKMEK
jgi:hypothetical protein